MSVKPHRSSSRPIFCEIAVLLVAMATGWGHFGSSIQSTAFAQTPSAKLPAKEESWYVVYLSGQRIGYQQSIVETVSDNGSPIVKTSSVNHMSIKRFGQALVMRQLLTTRETVDGNLLSFRYEMSNPPAATQIISGQVEGQNLTLTQEVNGQPKTKTQPWPADVKSPVYQDRVLKLNPMKPGETRSMETFVPDFARSGKMTLKAGGFEDVKMLDKTTRKLFKVSSTHTLLPGITTDSFLDETGESLKVSMNMIGSMIDMFLVSKDEALKAIAGAELDLAINTLVKVKPILKGHETKKIVYNVTIKDQDPANVIPAGDTQKLKKISADTAELTVISIPIPQSAKVGKIADEFLESSQYLQCKDDRVQMRARSAAGNATDPAEIAWRMEKYVHEKLTKKDFSTAMASAAEVAEKMEGDCTEHAVLLAGMLRAKGIPSRVAVGLVYAEQLFSFGGHMWTEAYLNGQWIPLDATLALRGIGAAHIKLDDSSLSDDGPPGIACFVPLMTVIGNLTLEIVSVE